MSKIIWTPKSTWNMTVWRCGSCGSLVAVQDKTLHETYHK